MRNGHDEWTRPPSRNSSSSNPTPATPRGGGAVGAVGVPVVRVGPVGPAARVDPAAEGRRLRLPFPPSSRRFPECCG